MNWMYDLFQTYENNKSKVGKIEWNRTGREYTLLPIAHTTLNAQIEVTVDQEGVFHAAKVIEIKESATVIPCTEASFNRTSGPVPHPLHDKLMYVAGDYESFGGVIKKGSTPYNDYLHLLGEWSKSPYSNNRVRAIYQYIKKGTLVQDLVEASILHIDKQKQLILKWTNAQEEEYGEKPDIFKVTNISQDKVFIRFNTNNSSGLNCKVWNDKEMYESFINFYQLKLQKEDFCYVTGTYMPRTSKHSSGIRRSGDSAKLISANDTTGFTYRGRFKTGNDVASLSYIASQKAHNALKWLISKQGITVDERVFLVWGSEETSIPFPQEDTLSFIKAVGLSYSKFVNKLSTKEFNNILQGYTNTHLDSSVHIMILDAATPGRLSVIYYRKTNKREYLNRLIDWHKTCNWLHSYRKGEDKKKIEFKGAPSTRDIAEAAYGSRANVKLIKRVMERMIPCIVEGQKVPIDIVRSVVYRTSNPLSMDKWEWRKNLSITCALLKKHYEEEDYTLSLDTTNTERDYLFGRLLAIADVLERKALPSKRAGLTNAIRYMNSFSRFPARTWGIIQSNLQPYQAKLGEEAIYYNQLIDQIASQIDVNAFTNKPLKDIFLLGFYSQRHELFYVKNEQ